MGGPGDTPAKGPQGPDKPEAKEFAKEFAKEGGVAEGEAEQVARELVEERIEELQETTEENIFESADFKERLDFLRSHWEKREQIGEVEKREYVLTARRKFIELRFLIWYARQNLQIEVDEGSKHEIYKEGEDVTVDLTESENFVDEVEKGVKEITTTTDQGEESIYENIEVKLATIRPKEFLRLPIEQRLLLVSNIKSWNELKDGGLLVFHFGGNRALEYQIGLGDLMPPEYRDMRVYGVIYRRRGNQGFYSNGRYLAIFTGTRVEVGSKDANYSVEKAYASKFGEAYKGSEERVDGIDGKREVTRREVIEMARNFEVDAALLEAVFAAIAGDPDNEIGDDHEFLHIAARYIQNAEVKYEGAHGSPMQGQHYTGEFVAYAMDRFNLFAEYFGAIDSDVRKVLEKYAALTGVSLEFDAKVSESRQKFKPKTRAEVRQMSDPSSYRGEVRYEASEIVAQTRDILRRSNERMAQLERYYNDLVARGLCAPEFRDRMLNNARTIYASMNERMGTWYHSTVYIDRPGKSAWGIKNSCVGAAMKACEDVDFRLQRGRQAGKPVYNFYWGAYSDGTRDFRGGFNWLRSMVDHDSQMITVKGITPQNCDALLGQYLAPGECAPAGLSDHALWLYRDPDGKIMMYHSGADVRPKRISLAASDEVPPGYERRGNYAYKKYHGKGNGESTGSKVNEVPFAYFLSRKPQYRYVKLVPLRNLVTANFPELASPAVA